MRLPIKIIAQYLKKIFLFIKNYYIYYELKLLIKKYYFFINSILRDN